eukprot:10817920-Prorocentrum_lima.AAC.1
MTSSLVGSEMCIRDSPKTSLPCRQQARTVLPLPGATPRRNTKEDAATVSYTHLTLPTICSV